MSTPHGEHLLLVGSGNPGKQQEWRELLAGIDAVLVVPQDLEPSTEGVDLLYAMRQELGLLPDGAPSPEELLADGDRAPEART